MKYDELRKLAENYPYFRSHLFTQWAQKPAVLRRQVSDWIREGKVIALKRGLYTLNDRDRKRAFSKQALASELYSPSYLSLESALSYYQMIPERVELVTSVTSKKTQVFTNSLGSFKYFHIKQAAFTGFIQKQDEFENHFFLATPEKALIDFFYFRARQLKSIQADVFEASFRLQNCEQLNIEKLQQYCELFQQKKLAQLVQLFIQIKGHL